MSLLLGIDTGGTYTDAVLVTEDLDLVASAKALTTKHDLAVGVRGAMEAVLAKASERVAMVSLSTTLATNALVEGHGSPIALILIGYPPDSLERAGLKQALGGCPVVFVGGGHRADGNEQQPLDLDLLAATIDRHAGDITAFAVSGYFAVRNPAHEHTAHAMIAERCGLPVTLGHQLSAALDAPRRALTAALNARLIGLLAQLIHAVRDKMADLGIQAPLMVVKGDGSLITADVALECPVETILSGPAASVVGARHMVGTQTMLVSDIGGTTTDIALLRDGQPVLNRDGAMVGGWRTMVEAVQVHTFGLGGDSDVSIDHHGELIVGPRRAMPVSLLIDQHPQAIERLKIQLDESVCRAEDGAFAIRLRQDDGGGMSYAQRKVWNALANGPVDLRTLISDHTVERPLRRLIDRGLVIISRLTPSDCAHILGRQHTWNAEGARLSARLALRWANVQGADRWRGDTDALARDVVDRVAHLTGRCVVTSALAERSSKVMNELPPGQRALVDAALSGGDDDILDFAVHLKHPLVGIGAPAALYYPQAAEKLHATLIIPEHAAVANALGAVAGGIIQRSVAHITPQDEEAFRVHWSGGVDTFATLDSAAEQAIAQCTAQARADAERAGAQNIEVSVDRKDNVVASGGREVFFESQITVRAYGRPRIAG